MKKICLLLFILCCLHNLVGQNDTIWYNENWSKEVSKKEGLFYHLKPKAVEGGYWIEGYYRSGNKQVEGLSKEEDREVFDGLVSWYKENGDIIKKVNYKNGVIDGVCTSYLSGKVVGELVYKKGKPITGDLINYDEKYNYYYLESYKNGHVVKRVVFDEKLDDIRSEITYEVFDEGFSNFEQKYYDSNNKLEGVLTGKQEGNACCGELSSLTGQLITYTYNPMRKKDVYTYKDDVIISNSGFYPSGQIRELVNIEHDTVYTTYYDAFGKSLGVLKSKPYGTPISGKKVEFNWVINSTDTVSIEKIYTYKEGKVYEEEVFYDNGVLQHKILYEMDSRYMQYKEKIAYNKAGEQIGKITYKDGQPYNGTDIKINNGGATTYKNGLIVDGTAFYSNGSLFKEETETKSVFYDKSGKEIGKLTYKTDAEGNKLPDTGALYKLDFMNDDITAIEYFSSGTLEKEVDYEWYDHTIYKTTISFFDSDKKNREQVYYANGELKTDTYYDESSWEEKTLFYDKNGKLLSEYFYQPNHGTMYGYFDKYDLLDEVKIIKTYDNGELVYEKRFKIADNNKIYTREEIDYNGDAFFYNDESELIAKGQYKEGEPWNGHFVKYKGYEGYMINQYANGVRNGEQLFYSGGYRDEPLWLSAKKEYSNGVLQGFSYRYYKNGNIEEIVEYKDGYLDGSHLVYSEDGQVLNELIYKAGKPYEGKEIRDLGYDGGIGITKRVAYYKAGKLVREERWKQDKLFHEILYSEDKIIVDEYDVNTGSVVIHYEADDEYFKNVRYTYYDSRGKLTGRGVIEDGIPKEGIFYIYDYSALEVSLASSQVEKISFLTLEVKETAYILTGFDVNKKKTFTLTEDYSGAKEEWFASIMDKIIGYGSIYNPLRR